MFNLLNVAYIQKVFDSLMVLIYDAIMTTQDNLKLF